MNIDIDYDFSKIFVISKKCVAVYKNIWTLAIENLYFIILSVYIYLLIFIY